MAELYRQLAGANRPRGTQGLLVSCPRSDTGGNQPWFSVWPLLHTSKSSTSSNQTHIPLQLLQGTPRLVTCNG